MGPAKSRRDDRKRRNSARIVESDSREAGENLEYGQIKKTELAPDNQFPTDAILFGCNHLGDTQLMDDIGADEESQLLVDESEKEDCSDSDTNGTEIIGTLRDDEDAWETDSADPTEKATAASRCLSEHAGSVQAIPASVYTQPLHTVPNKMEVELDSYRGTTQAEVKQKQVWNENRSMEVLGNSSARKFFSEDKLFNGICGKMEDVNSTKLHGGEQLPVLSYICSQEPGEFSQANALGIVDKLLDIDDGEPFVDIVPKRSVEVKMASISGANGPRNLARRQDLKNPIECIDTFDWIDSREDEGGGDLFTKRRDAFFDSGHRRKSFTEPCRSRKITAIKAENLVKNIQENQQEPSLDHESRIGFTLSDSRISLSSSVNLAIERTHKAKVMRSLFGNLNEQEHAERLEQLAEPPNDSGTAMGIDDVGIDTQMAAEVMQTLGCGSLINNVGEDIPAISRKADSSTDCSVKRRSKLLPHLRHPIPSKQPCSNSDNAKELAKQRKCGTRAGGGQHHSSIEHSRSSRDDLVEKKSSMKISDMEIHNIVNSTRRGKDLGMKSPEFLKGKGEDSVMDLSSSIEPVAHRTRKSVGKKCGKYEHVLSNYKDGVSDQMHGRTPRHTRSSLATAAPKIKKQVPSISPFHCMPNDSAVIVHRIQISNEEEKKQFSPQKKRAKACNNTSSTCTKQVVVEQVTTDIVGAVKARRQSSIASVSLPLKVGQISSHQNGAGMLDDDAGTSCFPCDGELSTNKRHSFGIFHAANSMLRKPKKGFIRQKGCRFDTTLPDGCHPSTIVHEKSPSSLQASATSNPLHCSINIAEPMEEYTDQISSPNSTTPVKDVNAASPVYMVNGAVIQSCKPRTSMSPLRRELIRLDAIKPELSPVVKDASRRKRDIANIRVLFSHHLGEDVIKQQKKILDRLGISTASSSLDATHFVTDKFVRTRNMLESIALGKPVVTPSWLESCGQACCFIDDKKYILRDAKKEREIGFNMSSSLTRSIQKPLLQDRRVLVTQNVKPSKELIINLVKAAHGLVAERVGRSATVDLLIISCEEDRSTCMPLLEKGAKAYSSELILNGIVIQKLEFDRHLLFIDNKITRSSRLLKT